MSRDTHESIGHRPASAAEGWAALGAGRWDAARRAFATALCTEETPEAFEGLSWAAWWLDDAATAFDARKRAYRLYRTGGEAANAARMATWLAADHLDFHGALAVANGWLRRARRLLRGVDPGPDHGWLAFHEGYIALVRGDIAGSRRLARRTAALGRRFGVPDLWMLGLALRGSVLVACAEIEDGMGCLDEATAAALDGDVEIPISRAWTCCFLVSACEAVRDYQRAFEWCDRIAEFVERYGSRYMLGLCRQHYGAVQVWRGRWAEAGAELEAAVDAYTRSRPAFARGALVELAELRRRQGLREEAERLLGRAGAAAGLVCRARLALDRGDARGAAELCERALRQLPEPAVLNRAPALEVLIAARAARGDVERASSALRELEEVARRVGTRPLLAAARLAAGIVAAAGGFHEDSRRLLEDAVDAFERCGAPFEAARARLELARTLDSLRRVDDAAREAKAGLSALSRLGAAAEEGRAHALLAGLQSTPSPATPSPPQVTRREREVLRCVAEGLTNREIAERLVVSEHTVHRHVTNILRKLDLRSRAAAVAHAARAGLLEPPRE